MIIVSDTSPIRALHALGLLDLVRSLYGDALIPPAVADELRRRTEVFEPLEPTLYPFMSIQTPIDRAGVADLQQELDPGESEAIALAIERGAALLLIDEHLGRAIATSRGLRVVGTLGVLLEARRQSLIPAIAPLIVQLRAAARFRLSDQLVREVLRLAGE